LLTGAAECSIHLRILQAMLRIVMASDPLAIHQDGRTSAQDWTRDALGGNAVITALLIYGNLKRALGKEPWGVEEESDRANIRDARK
jgi:hypothetical protein